MITEEQLKGHEIQANHIRNLRQARKMLGRENHYEISAYVLLEYIAEVRRLRAVLEWYADLEHNYYNGIPGNPTFRGNKMDWHIDDGERARLALEG